MTKNELLQIIENKLLKVTTLKDKLSIVADYAKKLTKAERCSIFSFDEEKDQLHSLYSDGIKGTLKLKSNVGIVGYTFHKKIPVLENDISNSSIFFNVVDQKSGYKTKQILAIPILHETQRLGVIQLLNKDLGFTIKDKQYVEILITLLSSLLTTTHNVQTSTLQNSLDSYLENKKLYLMEDGSAYYKILEMKREYFIAADKCYLLDEVGKEISLYYYGMGDEFLFEKFTVKIDKKIENICIAEKSNTKEFIKYNLEQD